MKIGGVIIYNKHISVTAVVFFLIMAIFGYTQWRDKLAYEEYLSFQIKHDLSLVWGAIKEHDRILGEIIEEEQISKNQIGSLHFSHGVLLKTYSDFGHLGFYIGKKSISGDYPYRFDMGVSKINYYFERMDKERLVHDVTISLDDNDIEKISIIKGVNEEWLTVEPEQDKIIADDYWLTIWHDLHEVTNPYKHPIESLVP